MDGESAYPVLPPGDAAKAAGSGQLGDDTGQRAEGLEAGATIALVVEYASVDARWVPGAAGDEACASVSIDWDVSECVCLLL